MHNTLKLHEVQKKEHFCRSESPEFDSLLAIESAELCFDVLDHSAHQESYDQMKIRLKSIREKFLDADFPPEILSIVGEHSNILPNEGFSRKLTEIT